MKKYILTNKTKLLLARTIDLLGKPVGLFSRGLSPLKPSKIVLLQLDHIGDVVFTTAAVKAIRKKYPDAEIISLVGRWAQPVLAANPRIDRIIEFDARWFDRQRSSGKNGVLSLAGLLREIKPGLAIDFRGDLRHNLAMFLAGIPNRLGFGITGGGFLLTREVEFRFDGHAVERHLAISDALEANTDAELTGPEVFLESREIEWVEEFLSGSKLKSRMLIGVHPEAGTQAKEWPLDNFIRTVELMNHNLTLKKPVFVFTGTQPYGLSAHNIVNLGGKLSLRQLAALQSKLDLFVCGDTGPLHMANAVGCPTVAVYSGTNDVKIWGPWQGKSKVLQTSISCAPCGKCECDNKECLTSITPQMVAGACLEILNGST